MKRALALTLTAVLALTLLCACGSANSGETLNPSDPPEETASAQPTPTPSPEPSPESSAEPSSEPSEEPSAEPSAEPAMAPSEAPSAAPTPSPTPTPTPEPTPAPTPTPTPTPEPTPEPAGRVDLAAFYESVTSEYEFAFLKLAVDELLDGFYPGLTEIETEQCLVYVCQMSMNNGEIGLVQVKNSEDVDAVKAVFQARIDYMVGDGNGPGGAWYPGPTAMWENHSRVVSNGNYVMMVVHGSCDAIVSLFNDLF